ncbi:glutathione peroxidase [Chryseosolibacter indicus]|uniref:Glutathione peroxidase n=1 Tax=Chryseosolibacter indicus TaxID=2782351 RepID=A0ABS5VYG5_9BACT|nr:glutathione peroxidase [Chryseosolibacter indicus]MBT1706440.1 glutathione peroxidase [Chryseosolibacter indicus]
MSKGLGIVPWLSSFISRFSSLKLEAKGSVYDFDLKTLSGKQLSLNQFKGKKLLIVNTASKCGFTSQYQDLQQLHNSHKDKVVVLGFPSNDFLWQEPGGDEEIATFCEVNYGVTFPMSQKISVRGRNCHPLFQWLAARAGKAPSWNFCKYLVDEKGEAVNFYSSKVLPTDPEIINKIVA